MMLSGFPWFCCHSPVQYCCDCSTSGLSIAKKTYLIESHRVPEPGTQFQYRPVVDMEHYFFKMKVHSIASFQNPRISSFQPVKNCTSSSSVEFCSSLIHSESFGPSVRKAGPATGGSAEPRP